MAENTKIQWTDHTFNPWLGCARVSEGCQNCYAEFMMDHRYHRVRWGEDGTRLRTKTWNEPPKWDRQAKADGYPHKVFCASLADVFEDREELLPWREDLFTLIDQCQNLNWLLLTKRPQNIRLFWEAIPDSTGYYLQDKRENVWLGTSIANQRNADECIDKLLESRALSPVLFLSLEPQIGFVDLKPWLQPEPLIDWVIVGGESEQGGPARPFHLEWAADMLDQCAQAEVPCFFKQSGANAYHGKRPIKFKDAHGGNMVEWPEHLRVRQCPETYALA